MTDTRLKSYRDAWNRLKETELDKKTSWGKLELKTLMDKILIECMETYLE